MSTRGERTQQQQIKDAKRAYILTLDPAGTRFSVYLDDGNGLDALWPHDSQAGAKSAELLPGQVHKRPSERGPEFPAFHFHLTGYGYSKRNEIRDTLRHVNPELEVLALDGWNPSHSM